MSENEFDGSARTVAEIGEFGLIDRVARPVRQGPSVLLGPGDDAAVIAAPDGRVAASVDLLVEGRHFRRDWSDGYQTGRKAAAQNLADIAAMGARPTALLVGLSMPGDTPLGWVTDLTAGLAEESALVGASVAGGDTTRGEQIVIAVTALGNLEGRSPVLRSGARPGDQVAVAGELGWSAAGLELLGRGAARPPGAPEGESAAHGHVSRASEHGDGGLGAGRGDDHGRGADSGPGGSFADGAAQHSNPNSDPNPDPDPVAPWRAKALARHRSPEPPYAAGPAAASGGATAMLDVSDGLLADLGHIARESRVAIDLDPESFPIGAPLRELAADCRIDPVLWFLTGGEDHALAGCFPAGRPLPAGWVPIGRVTEPAAAPEPAAAAPESADVPVSAPPMPPPSRFRVTVSGVPWPGSQGWDHFAVVG